MYEGHEVPQEEINACIDEIQLQRSRSDILDAEIEDLKKAFLDSISKYSDKVTVENSTEEKQAPADNTPVEVETTASEAADE